jgi:DNA-binding transcriptional LysR family regulator
VDLHEIDLNLLVAFDARMAERSVTRAGRRIGRTQPAMSAALSRLRGLLKDELFIRIPAGLQPTARALELAEPLSQALAEIERTLDFTQGFDPASSTASFTLGLSDHPAFVLLPALMARFRDVAPTVTLCVLNFTARDDAVSILDAGRADLAVGVPPTVPVGGRILSQALFDDRFVTVARKDHPIVRRPLDLTTFLDLSHVLVSPENDRFGVVDAALARMGLKRRVALTLPNMYAAPAVVATSDTISTLMAGVVSASGYADRLQIFEPPVELTPVSFMMAWHRRSDAHPAQRWLRSCISSLFAG